MSQGLGAFVQGLTQGYQIGDRLLTNEQDREFRGLQMNKVKRDLETQGEIDTARKAVVAASRNLIANPDDSSIRDNHRQALLSYTAVAAPERLPDIQRTFKAEDLDRTSQTAATVIRGLLAGDPSAIPAAAKLNGFIPNGLEIDTNNSAVGKDGAVKFSLVKTGTGEPAGERLFNREQLVTMGLGFMSSPDKFFELSARMFEGGQDRAVRVRGQDMEARSSAARTAVAAQGNQINAGLRADAAADRALATDLSQLQKIFAPRIKAIQDNIDNKLDPKAQSAALSAEEARMGLVDSIVRINAERGIRVPVLQVSAQADALARGEGIVGVPKGMENSGYGLHRNGYLVPLPPNARVTPKQ